MTGTRGNAEHPCATGCGFQAHQHRICSICAGNLERWLAEMEALEHDLDITLSRQARIGGATNGSRTAERPLPYDPRASEAAAVLRSALVGWVREIHDTTEQWPADGLHAVGVWLYARLPRLLEHPAAEEAVDEIGAATRLARQAIDRPPLRIYAGVCGTDGCPTALYAKPASPDVSCPTCGTRHTVADRRDHMLAELDGMLLTVGEIVNLGTYLEGVDRARARALLDKWVERGRLIPHGIDRNGHGLYPFGDTIRAILATPSRARAVA